MKEKDANGHRDTEGTEKRQSERAEEVKESGG